jgi:hypothetical protein
MATTYHAGRRIQGTSTDFGTDGAGIPAGAVGWKELGRSTLSGTSQDLSVSSLPDKRYYMVLSDCIRYASGTQYIQPDFQFNGDTGTNYASRWCWNGGGEGTLVNYNTLHQGATTDEGAMFQVSNIANLAGKEKMVIGHQGQPRTSGSGVAPTRGTWVGKWANTSDAIHTINTWESGTGSYASGSETVILGWDPADTHTDNFWEELGSDTGDGSSVDLTVSGITAKKYLWIQLYADPDASWTPRLRFNSDTGSNYSDRYSIDGGTDGSDLSSTGAYTGFGGSLPQFQNIFMINNSSRQKFGIAHMIYQDTAGAGTAPRRVENSFKWTNTSSQITTIAFDSLGGTPNLSTDSYLKVWGHD